MGEGPVAECIDGATSELLCDGGRYRSTREGERVEGSK